MCPLRCRWNRTWSSNTTRRTNPCVSDFLGRPGETGAAFFMPATLAHLRRLRAIRVQIRSAEPRQCDVICRRELFSCAAVRCVALRCDESDPDLSQPCSGAGCRIPDCRRVLGNFCGLCARDQGRHRRVGCGVWRRIAVQWAGAVHRADPGPCRGPDAWAARDAGRGGAAGDGLSAARIRAERLDLRAGDVLCGGGLGPAGRDHERPGVGTGKPHRAQPDEFAPRGVFRRLCHHRPAQRPGARFLGCPR